jgi:oxygen-independent coproporphyrinogen-3 oxidase
MRKCPYCDFNSHQIPNELPEQDYITALFADLEQDLPKVWGRSVRSIFIGGGTPSLFSPDGIDQLLSGIRARLPLIANPEITLEANPGTVDSTRFLGFKQAGVNRLSIGIQSFNDNALQKLGRIHGRSQAITAIEAAKLAGFKSINIDLMFGLPAQSLEFALQDLEIAVSYKLDHISWYQLTIEQNTLFYHQKPSHLPNDDLQWTMQTAGQRYLAKQGYQQYEISAYAKPEQQCQHNLNYWKFGDYLGIGAGAHAKITEATSITRLTKQRHPYSYIQNRQAKATTLTAEEASLEFMINALRLTEGFIEREFIENTGLNLSYIETPLQQAYIKGWLNKEKGRIYPTKIGKRFLDDLLSLFVAV